MYNKIIVIGLGTLGGFLCKYISELDCTKELVIIDYDIVESKNIFKSVYTSKYIGDYKVDALANIINDISITKMNLFYVEGKTKLPESDLVIDCRDIVCNRKSEIDARFYISDRVLIIDCRKNVYQKQSYNGTYSTNLTRGEISKAAFYASQVIESYHLKNMIKNNLVQRISLSLINEVLGDSIKKSLVNKLDIIYEASSRLQCINESIIPILDLNKHQDVEVFVGEKPNNVLQFPVSNEMKNKHIVLKENTLNNSIDVIKALTDLISEQSNISNYIVTIRQRDNQKYVELLEETGAA